MLKEARGQHFFKALPPGTPSRDLGSLEDLLP